MRTVEPSPRRGVSVRSVHSDAPSSAGARFTVPPRACIHCANCSDPATTTCTPSSRAIGSRAVGRSRKSIVASTAGICGSVRCNSALRRGIGLPLTASPLFLSSRDGVGRTPRGRSAAWPLRDGPFAVLLGGGRLLAGLRAAAAHDFGLDGLDGAEPVAGVERGLGRLPRRPRGALGDGVDQGVSRSSHGAGPVQRLSGAHAAAAFTRRRTGRGFLRVVVTARNSNSSSKRAPYVLQIRAIAMGLAGPPLRSRCSTPTLSPVAAVCCS
ncbi:hypothetical protein Zmor_008829 [Zophobas morio]|uniref:Uncharacterized protein n=1 Tax=Zophobas morio TaxID=2755281 RepID=A0AA38LZ50_9CUCU|nr:hypothetical protein Zmor_008829 [Zophobas morio]